MIIDNFRDIKQALERNTQRDEARANSHLLGASQPVGVRSTAQAALAEEQEK